MCVAMFVGMVPSAPGEVTASSVAGDVDYALYFDGTSQYATALDNSALDIRTAISMQAWVRPTSACVAADCMIINKEVAYELAIHNGTYQYAIQGMGGSWFYVNTGVTPRLNQWQHVAITRAAGADVVKFYFDGHLAFTGGASAATTGQIADSPHPFTVGGRSNDVIPYVYASFFPGAIDEVRLWNVERSATEVVSDMHSYGPINANGLVAYYDFNEGPDAAVGGRTVFNRAAGATSQTHLRTVGSPTYADVKQTTFTGPNTVVTFPRSYLTAAGGWRAPSGVSAVRALVVGGGGGGGGDNAGGGGAGGVYDSGTANVTVSGAVQPIRVGQGGPGTRWTGSVYVYGAPTGQASSALGLSAGGGGLGGTAEGSSASIHRGTAGASKLPGTTGAGGSGGGGSSEPTNSSVAGGAGGTGPPNGFAGGAGRLGASGGGGGGGAGATGGAAIASTTGANGGAGVTSDITGVSTPYGGGGGGGGENNAPARSSGGSGGGGAGASGSVGTGDDGAPNTGGGGGGGTWASSTVVGGNGGSGVVIVAYTSPASAAVDYALSTNGSSQFGIASSKVLNTSADYTVEAWVWDNTANQGWQYIVSQGVPNFWLGLFSGTQEIYMSDWRTGVNLPVGEWVHLAVTKTGTTVTLFMNGAQVAQNTAFSPPSMSISGNFTVGRFVDTRAEYWDGRIDEVKVWNSVRTATEISAGMHTYISPSSSNLVAYYDFNEGTGATVSNRVTGATASTHLALGGTPPFVDVKQTTFIGSDTLVTFPRSYITSSGGWSPPNSTTTLQYLVVAGGGGGGGPGGRDNWVGGGGAGGQVSTGTLSNVSATLSVTVGVGGRGGPDTASGTSANALEGGNSQLGSVVSLGGGRGGSAVVSITVSSSVYTEATYRPSGTATGGGGGVQTGRQNGATGTLFSGGNGFQSDTANQQAGGGGAGAGANGTAGTASQGGGGGMGALSNITGVSTRYGGGGGGGTGNSTPGRFGGGGTGGGGNGGMPGTAGSSGTPNTGGGGGGVGGVATDKSGGNGGAGVVMVRYSTVSTTCTGAEYYSENGYAIVAFTTVSAGCTWTVPAGVASIDYLVVAGGGGGGHRHGGGGGAGGLLSGTNVPVTAGGTASIAVGAGGTGVAADGTGGSNGGNSQLTGAGLPTVMAIGGGMNLAVGGSGGGANGAWPGGSGTAGQGNPGGTGGGQWICQGTSSGWCGGGGGGAGAAGQHVDVNGNNKPGDGGVGATTNLLSTTAASFLGVGQVSGGNVYLAGGGGGGADVGGLRAAGGLGGGANGMVGPSDTVNHGIANTGGGGGGGGYTNSGGQTGGGNGGSGVVIVRYSLTTTTCAPVTYTAGSYTVAEFQDTGSCRWTVPAGITLVEVLAVGGGGGGGAWVGGGGGGGGVTSATTSVTPGASITVTVGAGGAGSVARTDGTLATGSNGSASSFSSVTAAGGGRGALWTSAAPGTGSSVATGGGGAQSSGTYAGGTGTAATPNRVGGNARDNSQPHATGGGAGAGGNGESGTASSSGAGGVGVSSSITGATVFYGGGGGGSGHGLWSSAFAITSTFPSGAGGLGGGGAGGGPTAVTDAVYGGDGTDGLGGGGGGAGTYWGVAAYRYSEGGDGGDGVVIVRYIASPCTTTEARSGAYMVVTFAAVGNCLWNVPAGVTSLDYLVVAGGGGGGAFRGANTSNGGGGGAGGVLDGTGLTVTPLQQLSISVGDGGAGGISTVAEVGDHGDPGQDSSVAGTGITTITAIGGGFGGGNGATSADYGGGNGGSGGGSLGTAVVSNVANGGTGVAGPPRQGNNGGSNIASCGNNRPAGGGGGAGAAGAAGACPSSVHQSGAGGVGRTLSITGSDVVYGGGGGGGGAGSAAGQSRPGSGGAGGGGAGGGATGTNGTDGLGAGGGGAGGLNTATTGGSGGSGVVILRYVDRFVTKVAGDNQTGTGNTAAAVNPKVQVVDTAGNGVDGVTVSFTAGANSGSVGTASVITSGGGFAETAWTFGTAANQTLNATMSLPGSNTETFAATVTVDFQVNYDANGGTGAPVQASANLGSTFTVSSTVPTLVGYTFSSWNTALNGSGTSYAPGATFTMSNSAVTLYAQWTLNTHNVIYDATGGSGAPGTASATYGSTVTISSTRPTRVGHTFTGWNTAANGSGTGYSWNGTAFSPASFTLGDANVTLHAQWSVNSYTVTYDANGGTGAPGSQTANYNTSITASSTAPTRVGHTFSGWNTAANGSGTSAAAGSSFTVTGDVTLHAQWSVNSHTVTYDANTGSGAPSSVTATYGSTITISSTRPTRVGHTFTGWNTAANGSGTGYAWNGTAFSPASFTLGDADVILYARWSVNSYTVTYDANDGTGAPGSQTANYNTSITVSSTTPTRSGYTFNGWNTAANGSGSDYSAGTSLLVTDNVVLYAKWVVQTFSISYDANGGAGAPGVQSGIAFGTTATVSSTVPTRSGYTFAGWNTAANGTGTGYASAATFTMPASNVTLHARWTATIQTVSYDANGGTGAPSADSVATDATATVSASVPVRAGYTFQRWNTAANGSGTDRSSGSTFTMGPVNVVLYAVWLANTYPVTYDSNGGVSPPSASTAQTDSTFTVSSSLPTRAGYTFSSWNTARNGSGTHHLAGATFTMPASSLTLFAQWSANANNLVYNANGGTSAPANTVATTDSSVAVSSSAPVRSGFTFTGWNTAANGSGTSYAPGATFTMPTSHLTLFAQWSVATFQVVYDANGGSGAPQSTSGTYTSIVTLTSTAPTFTGYTFLGWGTASDGSGTNYANGGAFVVPAQNTTLYAVWVADVNDVYYVVNGGTGGPASVPAATNSPVVISSTIPTRTGHSFTGWTTAADGSGTAYSWNGTAFSPSTFTMPGSDEFLYARWSVNSHTVTYDVNGGTGAAPTPQTAQFRTPVTLVTPSLTRAGWTFVGWNTMANGSGVQLAPGTSYTMGALDITLYAEWSRNVNAVIFDALGGVSAPDARFGATGTTVTLPNTVPVREGHTFVRWEDSTQTAHDPGDTFTMPVSSVTLFARWSINSYSLTYDVNGGTGSVPAAQSIEFSSQVTVAASSLSRTGHTFQRWNTAADGTGTDYAGGATFQMPSRAVTLYAQWSVVPAQPTTTTTVPATATSRGSTTTVPTPSTTTTTVPDTSTSTTLPGPAVPVPGPGDGGGGIVWVWIVILGLALTIPVWVVARKSRRRD